MIVKICLVFICSIVARYYYRVNQLSDDLDEDLLESMPGHSSRNASLHGSERTPRQSYGSLEGSMGISNPAYQYPNIVQTQPTPASMAYDTPFEASHESTTKKPITIQNQVSRESNEKRRDSAGSHHSHGSEPGPESEA